ncbi:hypothetical protein V1498_10430 [Peribacillus sp. SCS-26]|uniref:hypothetical protein n=1 Tax=Paraperibacillus marinus TaxID=3115295 RepID=UPI0039060952
MDKHKHGEHERETRTLYGLLPDESLESARFAVSSNTHLNEYPHLSEENLNG